MRLEDSGWGLVLLWEDGGSGGGERNLQQIWWPCGGLGYWRGLGETVERQGLWNDAWVSSRGDGVFCERNVGA